MPLATRCSCYTSCLTGVSFTQNFPDPLHADAQPQHRRSPSHCIEYVKLIQWEHEHPDQREFDADNEEHMRWVYEKALERAKSFGIQARRLLPRNFSSAIPSTCPALTPHLCRADPVRDPS